ncbi:MAG: HAMP domain-containing protein [Desulfobacterium sp.]|nr:HAMP domain-containing protein [Desulfobacterium sp.]
MRLQYKFFICFLSTALLVVLLLGAIVQWFAARNFAEFVASTDLDRMDKIVSVLTTHYRENRDWEAFSGSPSPWHQVLGMARPDTIRGLRRGDMAKENRPRPSGPNGFFPGPPLQRGPEKRHRVRPSPAFDPLRVNERLCLFDSNQQWIAGPLRSEDKFSYREITLSGRVIGFLGLKIPNRVNSPLGLAFLKKQTQAIYLISGLILLLAALVSYFLARHLLAPIQALSAWTNQIKAFDFTARIDVASNDELGMLARDFSRMARTLEAYEQMRKNWVSDISHELRTPVAVLKSKVEALQDGIRQPSREMIDSLHRDVSRLEHLIRDLQLLAAAESDTLMLDDSPVDVSDLLQEVLDHARSGGDHGQIKIEADLDPGAGIRIPGNRALIGRVFENLFTNSFRYTDSPGQLKVRLWVEPPLVRVCFEDSPPGVPDPALERIFDRLFRVDPSRSRALGGSGLGLSICRHIVESHQGTILASHSHLGGLMIQLTFPLTRDP